ncbi:hypothetical protein MAR_003501 [Mya arenaria]|uniref:Uncharacterized protein n=1 Tax=Mya arenaria TaxID=6604 RepID=A0ABY7G9N8_MYAAR|nr:hypothetical protein MAR_003501 [Mya arenaria]
MWCCLYILCSDLPSESSHKRVKYVVLRFPSHEISHMAEALQVYGSKTTHECTLKDSLIHARFAMLLFMECFLMQDIRTHAWRKQREERLSSVPDCVREKTSTIVTHIDYFNCEN